MGLTSTITQAIIKVMIITMANSTFHSAPGCSEIIILAPIQFLLKVNRNAISSGNKSIIQPLKEILPKRNKNQLIQAITYNHTAYSMLKILIFFIIMQSSFMGL
jgi:hypothetical protein